MNIDACMSVTETKRIQCKLCRILTEQSINQIKIKFYNYISFSIREISSKNCGFSENLKKKDEKQKVYRNFIYI